MEKISPLLKCSVCETIYVGNDENGERRWLRKTDSPASYNELVSKYEKNMTHGYCRDCYDKEVEKMGKMKKSLEAVAKPKFSDLRPSN